jgi:hypothetical protein
MLIDVMKSDEGVLDRSLAQSTDQVYNLFPETMARRLPSGDQENEVTVIPLTWKISSEPPIPAKEAL